MLSVLRKVAFGELRGLLGATKTGSAYVTSSWASSFGSGANRLLEDNYMVSTGLLEKSQNKTRLGVLVFSTLHNLYDFSKMLFF